MKGFGIYTCAKQANVAGPPALVTSKLTAALAQVPAIKKELDTSYTTLSMCKITKITPKVQAFFQKKLWQSLREKKGRKGALLLHMISTHGGKMIFWIQCQQTRKTTRTIANTQKVK
jgi:hypothetical protein